MYYVYCVHICCSYNVCISLVDIESSFGITFTDVVGVFSLVFTRSIICTEYGYYCTCLSDYSFSIEACVV